MYTLERGWRVNLRWGLPSGCYGQGLFSRAGGYEQQYTLCNTRESWEKEPAGEQLRKKKKIGHNSSQILTVSDKIQTKLWLSLSHFSPRRMDEVSHALPSSFRWGRASPIFTLLNLPWISSRESRVSHLNPRARPAPGRTLSTRAGLGWLPQGWHTGLWGLRGLSCTDAWVTAVNRDELWNKRCFLQWEVPRSPSSISFLSKKTVERVNWVHFCRLWSEKQAEVQGIQRACKSEVGDLVPASAGRKQTPK